MEENIEFLIETFEKTWGRANKGQRKFLGGLLPPDPLPRRNVTVYSNCFLHAVFLISMVLDHRYGQFTSFLAREQIKVRLFFLRHSNNMVRKLKYHEQKLLKKVDFISWKSENNIREVKVLRKYHLQKREDYTKYNKLCGSVLSLVAKIKDLDQKDPFRIEATNKLLQKLFDLGIISSQKNLSVCEKISTSSFCRRRLPVVMVRLKMAEQIKDAVKYIEQGHVRIGPEVVMDPAFLVSRNMEDYITWANGSKIRQRVMEYNDAKDDFDLL